MIIFPELSMVLKMLTVPENRPALSLIAFDFKDRIKTGIRLVKAEMWQNYF